MVRKGLSTGPDVVAIWFGTTSSWDGMTDAEHARSSPVNTC
jgi:hypothetical protein